RGVPSSPFTEVSRRGAPPEAFATWTWTWPGEPASLRNASRVPSGDQARPRAVKPAASSPSRTSLGPAPPAVGAITTRVVTASRARGASSIQATRAPSGDSAASLGRWMDESWSNAALAAAATVAAGWAAASAVAIATTSSVVPADAAATTGQAGLPRSPLIVLLALGRSGRNGMIRQRVAAGQGGARADPL